MRMPVSRLQSRAGFTILEVGMASFVLAMAIATAVTVLQDGLRAVDTARNMTLAGQIMQSEMEILRLQNWTQISALPATATVDPTTTITSGNSSSLDSTLSSIAGRFTCTRTVADITGRANIKLITLQVQWSGVDGRAHSVSYQTQYAKDGLSDYFYVAH
jgi:type II secretory pathway pseudopilin PulG